MGDPPFMGGEVEDEYERIWQPSLVERAVDMGAQDYAAVVFDHPHRPQREVLTDDVATCPFPDCRHSPMIAQLIVDKRIFEKHSDQLPNIARVDCIHEGFYQRRKLNTGV